MLAVLDVNFGDIFKNPNKNVHKTFLQKNVFLI